MTAPSSAPTPGPSAASAPAGRDYLQLVLVLGALTALGPLTIDTYLPALPAIQDELLTTQAAVQLTLSGTLLGMGLGQLVNGPASDAFGRRRPLLVGLALHVVASLLCATATSVTVLAAARLLQGLATSAVSVTAMAMVRDHFAGRAAARTMSHLALVNGAAPVLAPTLGGLILTRTDWRGVFLVLGGIALVQLLLAALFLRESLPPQRRRSLRPAALLGTYRGILSDPDFLLLAATAGLMFAAMFSYISGASFVLQGGFGLSEQQFGLAFGANAVGLVVLAQVNGRAVQRWHPLRLLTTGITMGVTGALGVVLCALLGIGGLWGVVVPLFVAVSAGGLSFPNGPALALTRHGEAAGSATAVLGALQFSISGVTTPLAGLLPGEGALPMGLAMLACTSAAAVCVTVLWRRGRVLAD
ncbi:multidrug effflux MFS transporter [Kytococcus sedentarius]|uniref:Drug resistance transporter, Bcr/CflA subfamily n=1 Tax=Kytococcus sedentarius (strain ATCC 14392 / DSM 20547 / JCM 11482 / CCUG 33030 / NBRC 15357 / NCTC 11040 / CCM 314 / 541) TaxID=478801 RepID=C7NKH9_KYTSD|nr:multidrug effflux MFS transporter [Kytococcus sedentarius]ACV07017.1 drug resistance transporter, Bcr/CflA subfamily [Kytococcus sedentarius DSM 20547]STX14155.1 Sulfonamide resistance protein [Kytococcus sedentarius]